MAVTAEVGRHKSSLSKGVLQIVSMILMYPSLLPPWETYAPATMKGAPHSLGKMAVNFWASFLPAGGGGRGPCHLLTQLKDIQVCGILYPEGT